MAAALATWYNNQYSPWNRTRRIQVSPFLARQDTNTSRTATQIIQSNNPDFTDPNMGDNIGGLNGIRQDYASNEGKLKDTLFGPSIGVVNPGPGWTHSNTSSLNGGIEKLSIGGEEDVLTTDVVKKWVAKSKETSEPTTTLQALVNLKRPTIRLLPLEAAPHPSTSASNTTSSDDNVTTIPNIDHSHHHHTQQHGLEFEFDCDAPKCGIYMYINGIPPSAVAAISINGVEDGSASTNANAIGAHKAMVFESIVPGGFGRKLTLAEGAMLELEKLDMLLNGSGGVITDDSTVVTVIPAESISGSVAATAGNNTTEGGQHNTHSNTGSNSKKRLTFFKHNRHQRSAMAHSRPAAGPALALVDAESAPMPMPTLSDSTPSGSHENKKSDMDDGVKVTLRLVAIDKEGREIRPANEQITYLHVVRMGVRHVNSVGDNEEEKEKGDEGEDTRPWVVRVIKREAVIGIHSFHLHEIYGLTSHASSTSSPIAPLPTSHTYPPTIDPLNPSSLDSGSTDNNTSGAGSGFNNDTPSECLLCLSSPREVVLLPCRHLVACRECAINMIEFGAGGTVVQHVEEPVAITNNDSENVGGENNGENANDGENGVVADTDVTGGEANIPGGEGDVHAPATTVTPPTPTVIAPPPQTTTTVTPSRRKRKPKGWFCPVCRQPYTSMLRITTNPPPASSNKSLDGKMLEDAKRMSTMSSDTTAGSGAVDPLQSGAVAANGNILPMPVTSPGQVGATVQSTQAQTRPGFLRHFSRASTRNINNASVEMQQQGGRVAPDLERQVVA